MVSQKRASIYQGAIRVPLYQEKKQPSPKKEPVNQSKMEQSMENYFSRQQALVPPRSETPRRFPMASPARREPMDSAR